MAQFRVHPVAALGLAFFVAMCGGSASDPASATRTPDAGTGTCAPDSVLSCDCANGVPGILHCSASNVWGACECTDECSEEDASRCVAPHSECKDSSTLRYFDNPSCQNGRCAWEPRYFGCGSQCSNGGCIGSSTAGGVGGALDAANGESAIDAAKVDSATQPECGATDVSRCIPPPSKCVSQMSMEYYVNPVCKDGHCAWEKQQYACYPCVNGGCLSTTTTGGVGP